MAKKRIFKWIALGLASLIVVCTITGYFVLRSRAFHRYVLGIIASRAGQAIGEKVQVGDFDFHLPNLRVDIYRISVPGTETNPAHPLLRVDQVEVELKIISLLKREIGLGKVEITHPVVHLTVAANGQTNLPHPPPSLQPSQRSKNTSLFNLAIDRFQLDRGQIDVNDRQIPLEARLRNLQAQSEFDALKREYDGELRYAAGKIQVGAYRPVSHSLSLSFSANPNEMRASPLVVRAAGSTVSIQATLRNYSQPVVNGSYSVRLAAAEAARIVRSTVVPVGEITTNGVFDYTSVAGRALLDSITLSGKVGSPHLSARLQQVHGQALALSGQYHLAGGNLTVNDFKAKLFGGRLAARLSIHNLAGLARGKLTVSLQSVSIGALRAALPANHWAGFPVAGSISTTAQASWQGALNQLRITADASFGGAVAVAGAQVQRQTIPLHATLRAAYDVPARELTLRQSTVATAQSEIDLNGSLGRDAALTIRARTRDLHEIDQLVTEVRRFAAPASTTVQAFGISGSALFQGLVQGTLQHPKLTGQLNANNLRIGQAPFPRVGTRVAVSDSGLALSQGELQAAHGNARFRLSLGLRDWTFSSPQPVSLELTANRMSIAALASVAHLKYPVQGLLSAQVSAHGTVSRPEGSGTIQIVNAEAWNQPIQQAVMRFQGNGTKVESTLRVETEAGNVNAAVTYSPANEGYQGQVTTAGLNLGRLRLLKAYQLNGVAKASVRGQGTLKAPGLQAELSIPTLRIGKEAITGVSAQATVANQTATLNLNSNFSGIAAHGNGTVQLTGDYNAALNLSTGTVEAGPLLSTYLAGGAATIQCETQLKAWLRGPLKDRQRLQAHLEIPMFRLGYQSVRVSSVSAITADYQNGSLVLKPAEIKGAGTDFRFQASLPLASNGQLSASAQGVIDFHLAQILDPDLTSSGQLQVNVAAQGTRSHPRIRGNARIVNAVFVAPEAPVGIQNMNGAIAFTSTRAEITHLTAQAGGGSVAVSGSVSFEHRTQFNLALNADNLHLAYPEGVSEVLAAQLKLLGTPGAALLSGQVFINSLALTPQFDLTTFTEQFNTVSTTASPSTGFASNIKLDVAVRSSHELTLTSDQLNLSGAADLRVVGTIDDPVVVGRVTLANGGTLIFAGNRYSVQTGTIDFVSPVMIEPVLDIRLATTIDQYAVTLTFAGPVDRLRTTYTSNPPLASADIISLLVSGQPTEAASSGVGAESMLAAGISQAGSRVFKMAGLSSLTIDPQVGGYESNPGVNIGMQKQVTKNLFFTFSVNTTTTQDSVVQVQYQFTRRWSVEALRDEVGGYSLEIRSHRTF
jgi:translocation and assembly module TamB